MSGMAYWVAATQAPLAALLTALVLAGARRRGLLDLPGRRRSHARPTPRGGGLGPLLAWLAMCSLFAIEPGALVLLAVAAVAAIGLLDDLRGLGVAPRLAVHFGAALALGFALAEGQGGAAGWTWLLVAVLVAPASLNFWNFMDGIDGLIALHSLFVALVIAATAALAGESGLAIAAAGLGAALLGFLPFNLPRARIFLGDVGSGGLGFALVALALLLAARHPALAWPLALVFCAPWIDAGLTLGHRMLAGRRWYAPHREHLYQWLVRRGRSHGHVDLLYLGWNLLFVTPLLMLSLSLPEAAPWAVALAYATGAGLWLAGKRALLREARGRADLESAA